MLDLGLNGKVAIITGGSDGLGRAAAAAFCIGLVRSAQIARRAKGDLEAHYAELAKQRVPLGRVAHASEFADLFAFLVSERASYITGASVNFDGGSGMTV